ncbi:MAG: family 1 glycosylhydrolase [Aquabacterium sp.]|nr:family 1 glycosylhydrolase [Aquabacterium sp.]
MKFKHALAALSGALCLWAGPAASSGNEVATSFVTGHLSAVQYVAALATSIAPPPFWNWVPNRGKVGTLGPDFMWGVAASGFQSEGHAPDSNWTRYIAKNPQYDAYRDSVDFYKHYEADLARAAALGVKTYRIGIEWARVEPQPGVVDAAALAFYDAVIARIVKLGMRPMLTLDHWVYPGWMADKGGWASVDMQRNWLSQATRVVDRYAVYNPIWITINEPAIYLQNEIKNGGLKAADLTKMNDGMVAVHRAIYDHIHVKQAGAMVSSNVAYISGLESQIDTLFFNRVVDKLDFIGIDYYYGLSVTDLSSLGGLLNNTLWTIKLQPEGIYYAMRHYAERYPKLPLYIVENGMPTQDGVRADGVKRGDALRDTVYWLQRAKADGMKVMGYNYWSLTDNYEWGSYKPRFGLYTVNVLTDPSLTRVATDAVGVYTNLIAAKGVPVGYKPTVAAQRCSLVSPVDSCLRPVR